MKLRLSCLAIALIVTCIASPVRAALTGYDNRALWAAAASPTDLITFEAIADGTTVTALPGITNVSGSAAVKVTARGSMPFPMFDAGDPLPSESHFLSNDMGSPGFATGQITFDLASPATAIGAYIADGAPLDTFQIELFNGITSLGTIVVPARDLGSSAFAGVVSTTPFTSARFFATSSNDSWGLDNLEFNARAAVAAPEPASAALGLLSLAALAARRRRVA